MNQTDQSAKTSYARYWQIPGSLLRGAANYAKSYVTWEGRDVSQINDAEFLRKDLWKENLKLLSKLSNSSTLNALTTKEIYHWQPKESFISEGFSSAENQMEALASQNFFRWMRTGVISGVAYFFFKSIQFNFNCLEKLQEKDCRILYGAHLSQPGFIAKVAFAAGLWTFSGWLMNRLSDYGLCGFIRGTKLKRDLIAIYRSTADYARTEFWNAVDNKDKATAKKIYLQVQAIKNNSDYFKSATLTHLGTSKTNKENSLEFLNSFNLLIEDLLSQNLEALFASEEVKNETAAPSVLPNQEKAVLEETTQAKVKG